MRETGFLLFALLAAAPAVAAEDEQAQLYQEGKKAFRSCAACHCTSEPTLKEDEDWLILNGVTNCIDAGEMTPRVRQALDVFLRSNETQRPLLVDEKYAPQQGRARGNVRVPATSGSAYLKADRESIRSGSPPKIRLYWQASEAGRALIVPAGRYQVINYRFYRASEDAAPGLWTLSVTDVNGCAEILVEPDGETEFPFAPEMHGALSVTRVEEGVKVALALRNEKVSVLTLSRGGEMCIPEFSVRDTRDQEIYRVVFENT